MKTIRYCLESNSSSSHSLTLYINNQGSPRCDTTIIVPSDGKIIIPSFDLDMALYDPQRKAHMLYTALLVETKEDIISFLSSPSGESSDGYYSYSDVAVDYEILDEWVKAPNRKKKSEMLIKAIKDFTGADGVEFEKSKCSPKVFWGLLYESEVNSFIKELNLILSSQENITAFLFSSSQGVKCSHSFGYDS